MQKREMLALLNDKVCNCQRCPELVASRTQTVFGEGDPNTRIVFMGEAPGKTEDKEGRPFCGQAGKLLDNLIKACGWEREEVYILNTVKCRPEYNRAPYPEEAKNCRQFLDLQLKIINPEIIVCLGAIAAQNLLDFPLGSVKSLRGNWYQYKNAKVRVTYHPAYLLRNPGDKSKVWDDMQEVMKVMNGQPAV